jgi:DNA invertase Pin-like site-specific DNA recombinase
MVHNLAMNGKFVAYYRVSTSRQGESGLGIEAQRAAVVSYLNGGKWQLLEEFTEVESGKKSKRPQLAAAMAAAKKAKATLIVAKLDRLARNLHFLSGLMESGVDFLAVDNPTANRLTVHILAAVAEDEGRRISERTKGGLAAAKARGTVLGKNGAKLAATNRAAADEFAADLKILVEKYLAAGLSRSDIADSLNRQQIATARGGRWHATSVQRMVTRLNLGA